jgi:hypothetical protein
VDEMCAKKKKKKKALENFATRTLRKLRHCWMTIKSVFEK